MTRDMEDWKMPVLQASGDRQNRFPRVLGGGRLRSTQLRSARDCQGLTPKNASVPNCLRADSDLAVPWPYS